MKLPLRLALLASLLLALGACGGGDSKPLDVGPDPDAQVDVDLSNPDTEVLGELPGDVDIKELGEVDGGEIHGECNKHEDCVGGYCIEFPPGSGENICAIPCQEECPEGYACKLVYIDGGSPVSVCLPQSASSQCTICNKDSECVYAGSRCVKGNAPYGYCVDRCQGLNDGACPKGHECRNAPSELNDGFYYCQPKAQSCCVAGELSTCDDNNPCTEEYCGPALGCMHRPQEGSCSGVDPCMEYSCVEGVCQGWPVTDDLTFDGVDDDCDGSTDEDVWRGLQILHHNYGSGAGWMNGPGMKLWGVVNAPGFAGGTKPSSNGELKLRPGMPLNP